MNWCKVKVADIIISLREHFDNLPLDMRSVIRQRFQDSEVGRLSFVTVSLILKRAYESEQTVLPRPPPQYRHPAQEGTLR